MSFELFIACRYIRAKQKQSFISLITILSVAGVAVGVMALIVVISVMAGFESDLRSRILGVESHLLVQRHGGAIDDYRKIIDRIRQAPGVVAATPFVNSQVMLKSSFGVSGAVLRGIDPLSAGDVIQLLDAASLGSLYVPKIEKERAQQYKGISQIILGQALARNLGLHKGDEVYVVSSRGVMSPMGHLPSMIRFKVGEIFESGIYQYDRSLAFVNINAAQRILRKGDTVSGIDIRVHDVYSADVIGKRIVDDLGRPFWFKDWMQMNQNLFSALKLEKTVMFIILALIVLVAAFNISSSLIMMVMEKIKDISILKAMGARDESIRRIFILKGMVIGIIGTAVGAIAGITFCKLLERYKFIELPSDVYIITTLPVQLKGIDVFFIVAAALLICLLATFYPAFQAARLNPVEAIRHG